MEYFFYHQFPLSSMTTKFIWFYSLQRVESKKKNPTTPHMKGFLHSLGSMNLSSKSVSAKSAKGYFLMKRRDTPWLCTGAILKRR